jgi:hypothetical protein
MSKLPKALRKRMTMARVYSDKNNNPFLGITRKTPPPEGFKSFLKFSLT